MNNIAISPHIFMYALQNQNVERKIAKKIDIKELNKEVKNEETSTNEEDSKNEVTNDEVNDVTIETTESDKKEPDTAIIDNKITNINDLAPPF